MPTDTKKIIQDVAEQEAEEKGSVDENFQLVVFELDKEEYAVEITDLQEILRIPEITPIPNAPDFISGIFNLRGKIIVVVDLEKRFNLERDNEYQDEGNIIFTEVNGNSYGIIVDQVTEIINVPKKSIQPTPALVSSKIDADYLKGVVVLSNDKAVVDKVEKIEHNDDSRLVILLDLKKMLQEKELLSFGKEIQKEAKDAKEEK